MNNFHTVIHRVADTKRQPLPLVTSYFYCIQVVISCDSYFMWSLCLSETIKVGLFVSYLCSLSRNNWENNAIPSNTRNHDLANFICYLHLFWLCWSLFIEDYAVLSWFWPTCFCSGLSIALARNYNSIMLQLMSDKLSRICILLL